MNHTYTILLLIILTACLSGVSSDVYAPSLIVIAESFGVTLDTVQTSMALFMIGISLSQLVYGPLSEGYGRKPVLLLGLSIMLSGSLICYTSSSIQHLLFGRFIQGLGAGAASSLWRTIFKDSFTDQQAAKYIPTLTIIVTFVVPAAPTLGAYLETNFGWRSVFEFLIIYGLTAILYTSLFFKETNLEAHKSKLNRKSIQASYKELLTSKIFMGYALCIFLSYGTFFSWLISGPVIVIKNMGNSQYTFGFVTLSGGFAMFLSALTNRFIAPKRGFQVTLRLGWGIVGFAGFLMFVSAQFIPNHIASVAIPIFIFYYGITFVWPATFSGAFGPFGHIAGYAGSLYSFLQMGGAGLLGLFISFLPDHNQIPLSIVMMTTPILLFGIYYTVIAPGLQEYEAKQVSMP